MRKFLLWILAVIITLGAAVYQRMTGPTYPLRGKAGLGDSVIKYSLPRSADNTADCEIDIKVPDSTVTGFIEYKRLKTDDPWTKVPLLRKESVLFARLPKQPAAGKLAYYVLLARGEKEVYLAARKPAIIRFKNPVPSWILVSHVIIIFLAMLFSTRAGLAALDRSSHPRKLALWAAGLLFSGGFIFGPLMQKFAFGQLWTGFPLGFDLTDNKTLVAMVGWIAALAAGKGGKPARGWVLAAAILLLITFSIPHSLLGSELEYSQVNTTSSGFSAF